MGYIIFEYLYYTYTFTQHNHIVQKPQINTDGSGGGNRDSAAHWRNGRDKNNAKQKGTILLYLWCLKYKC